MGRKVHPIGFRLGDYQEIGRAAGMLSKRLHQLSSMEDFANCARHVSAKKLKNAASEQSRDSTFEQQS